MWFKFQSAWKRTWLTVSHPWYALPLPVSGATQGNVCGVARGGHPVRLPPYVCTRQPPAGAPDKMRSHHTLRVVKPKRLRDRIRAMPFPVRIDEGVERHASVRKIVDTITVLDIGSVHGVLHAPFARVRKCTRSCGREPTVPIVEMRAEACRRCARRAAFRPSLWQRGRAILRHIVVVIVL
jgi:hypothetical protein